MVRLAFAFHSREASVKWAWALRVLKTEGFMKFKEFAA